jgi:hypothetical protein
MNERGKALIPQSPVHRRDFLRAVTTTGIATATAGAVPLVQAATASKSVKDKRKARYRADSAEVQAFYRVNRYPGQ